MHDINRNEAPTFRNIFSERQESNQVVDLLSLEKEAYERRNQAETKFYSLQGLSFDHSDTDFVLNTPVGQKKFTNWSFSQLCQRLGCPAGFMGTLPPYMIHDVFDWKKCSSEDRHDEVKLLLDNENVRAITGPDYGRIWDEEVIRTTKRIIAADPRWQFFKGNFSDRDMDITMIHSEEDLTELRNAAHGIIGAGRDKIYRGFRFGNSEVGARVCYGYEFWFQAICSNGMIVGFRLIGRTKIKHSKFAQDRFGNNYYYMIRGMMDNSSVDFPKLLDKARVLSLPPIRENSEEIYTFMPFQKGVVDMAISAAVREEGSCSTVADMFQGLTAVARDIKYNDIQMKLQMDAGQWLWKMTK